MIEKYILLSEKSWHDDLFVSLSKNKNQKWFRIKKRNAFNLKKINEINPNKIFIPHWSYIIPKSIFNKFICIVFHMTDLPFGRGGSPLQNLIIREIKSTKISAILINEGIDSGPIYEKKPLKLNGTAQQIFNRSVPVIEKMINKIINKKLKPIPQKGEIVEFKRRTPKESDLKLISNLSKTYDYIRMLDAENYPNAFLENKNLKFMFYNANFDKENNIIEANVRISKK